MCSWIRYRKSGDAYECISVSDRGEVEVLGRGTMAEIIQSLSSHDLPGVSPLLIEQVILELCKR